MEFTNKDRFLEFLQKNILSKIKNKLLFDNAIKHIAKGVLESNNPLKVNLQYIFLIFCQFHHLNKKRSFWDNLKTTGVLFL